MLEELGRLTYLEVDLEHPEVEREDVRPVGSHLEHTRVVVDRP